MKALNTLRYILFAVMVLGSFANFAQNEYGFTMLSWAHFGIAAIFFIEAIYRLKKEFPEGKLRAFYLFLEHFLLGCIFLGYFFRFQHLPGAAPLCVFGSFLLFMVYLIYGIRLLIKESKYGKLLAFVVFLFLLAATLALVGLTFKTMRWPGSYYMMWTAVISMILFAVSSFIKRKYVYKDTQISLYKRLMLLPGKPVMVFSYFALWVVYI